MLILQKGSGLPDPHGLKTRKLTVQLIVQKGSGLPDPPGLKLNVHTCLKLSLQADHAEDMLILQKGSGLPDPNGLKTCKLTV